MILAGVGGQGILSIATILGAAALENNLYLKQAEVHGMSQRGGDVQSTLRISSEPIASDLAAKGTVDMIVSLEPMETLRYLPWLKPEGRIVTNKVAFVNIPNYPEQAVIESELAALPAVTIFDMDAVAKETATARCANMVLLGAASPWIDIPSEAVEHAIATVFAAKGSKIVEMNIAAYRAGREKSMKTNI